jgi:phytoene desaturase (3,4-didehydrolycopene-forming)
VTYDSTGRTTGVVLANGRKEAADAVIVNADLVWAHNNLFFKEGEKCWPLKSTDGKEPKTKELLDPKLAKKLLDKPHS